MLLLAAILLAGILYFTVLRKPAVRARLRWAAQHLYGLALSLVLIFVLALIGWAVGSLVQHRSDFSAVEQVSAAAGTLVLAYFALVLLNTILLARGTRVAWLARIDLTKRRRAS